MTRINVGVRAKELTRQHLIAEHREIKRIPNCIKKGRYNIENMPDQFKLGAGHVKFFYNKLQFLHNRYLEIYAECIERGYNVTNYNDCFLGVPQQLYNDYKPTAQDRQLILDRIAEKLKK